MMIVAFRLRNQFIVKSAMEFLVSLQNTIDYFIMCMHLSNNRIQSHLCGCWQARTVSLLLCRICFMVDHHPLEIDKNETEIYF